MAARGLLSLPETEEESPGLSEDMAEAQQEGVALQTWASPHAAKQAQRVSSLGSGLPEGHLTPSASASKGIQNASTSKRSAKADR